MHRIFQAYIDQLAESMTAVDLRETMSVAVTALGLHSFSYLAMPTGIDATPQLISTYSPRWTTHYLRNGYERLDPVIRRAHSAPELFDWGLGAVQTEMSKRQQDFFDEASQFGIRHGFTIPIHDGRGPVAAVTFATDQRNPMFRRCIESHSRALQLMAMYFHARARRKLVAERALGNAILTRRESECLEWAAKGKSAWEIGRILGISRRTAAFHLDNAKAKLGTRSICQAVAKFTTLKATG